MRIHCPICDGAATYELPVLSHSGQGMISDGRLTSRSIHKVSCLNCGAGFCIDPPHSSEVSSWYSNGYGLSVAAPEADGARARMYADWLIAEGLHGARGGRLLEVGSGSGRLLEELAGRLANTEFVGCEPSLSSHSRSSHNVMLYRGGIDAIPAAERFDTIIAVNVIEHTPDPTAFLASLSARLAPQGRIFIVCPNGSEPNFELVFVDHLYSLTPSSIDVAARAAGLTIETWSPSPLGLGLFTLYRLSSQRAPGNAPISADLAQLAERRAAYLEAWAGLDEALNFRIRSKPCAAFGAGQMAALLRAYAPKLWANITHLCLDVPADGWRLDKPVLEYLQARDPGEPIVLATSPAAHGKLSIRLTDDGYYPVRFDDLIPC